MRIALDTNQLVRALMRPPELATFVMAWEARRFIVVGSRPLLDEYERVLAHPDVSGLIYPELLRAFRSHLIHDIEQFDDTLFASNDNVIFANFRAAHTFAQKMNAKRDLASSPSRRFGPVRSTRWG
jgi:hypothetical protein